MRRDLLLNIFTKNKVIGLLASLLVLLSVFAETAHSQQFYTLPDTNFRNRLSMLNFEYKGLVVGSNLNIDIAATVKNPLFLNGANISNASGLQYFTSVSAINLMANKLVLIDEVANLKQLTSLNLNFNELVRLPLLKGFDKLTDLQVQFNKLDKLPDLSGAPNLISLYINNNQLHNFPDLSVHKKLQKLDVGYNPFGSLTDFSNFPGLTELHIHVTGTDTIAGLEKLANLEILYAWGNKIRDLSGLSSNTRLNIFVVFQNQLKSLPDLSNKPLKGQVVFKNNNLTFEDLLPLKSIPGFDTSWYNPQNSIILYNQTVTEREKILLEAGVDLKLKDNNYSWFRDGEFVDGNNTGRYFVDSAKFKDAGEYFVEFTNPGLPGITLGSFPFTIKVNTCLKVNTINFTTLREDCKHGTDIILNTTLTGGKTPFIYTLIKSDSSKGTSSYSSEFKSLSPGRYKVAITDKVMCGGTTDILIKAPSGCDPVFSPDGDGNMDYYFIDEPGKVQIYDLGRNLVREFTAPGSWDGRKSDGSEAEAGLYAIIIDGKKSTRVSLIK